MIYEDGVIEKSNMIDLLTWMIKLKSNKINQISSFVSQLFDKPIVECNVLLEWIKNKDTLTIVKMEKDSDKELMGGAPITSNRFLEKPTDEIKNGDFKSYKKPRNTKK